METRALSLEMAAIRVRTHRMMAISVLIHVAAAIMIFAAREQAGYLSDSAAYTEITWLASPSPQVAQSDPGVSPPAPDVVMVKEGAARKPERKKKDVSVPPVEGVSEKINGRLARLQESSRERGAVAPIMASIVGFARPSAMAAGVAGNSVRPPVDLERSEKKIVPLERGDRSIATPVFQAITPADKRDREIVAEPAVTADLPGITISGPVTDRALMGHELPEYPEWARRDGIEVSVQLRFTVMPDGSIKENLLVEKSSGFGEFDSNAKTALSGWRFEALGAGEVKEQWGRIVFNYRLNKTGRDAEK